GQADGIVELGQLLAVREAHRLAQVHDQVAGDVGLGFELLDVVFVGFGEDKPVDVLGVVAGGVAAMLGKLDREAMKRRGMQTLEEALDHELGPQVQSLDLVDDFRLEIAFDGGHEGSLAYECPRRRSEVGSRRSEIGDRNSSIIPRGDWRGSQCAVMTTGY